MKRIVTLLMMVTMFNASLGTLNVSEKTASVENCSNFTYVAEKTPITAQSVQTKAASTNDKTLLGDWNIATYSMSTKNTNFEYFNENYYYQRCASYSRSLERSTYYDNDYSEIKYTDDGMQYTEGYDPNEDSVRANNTIGIMGNGERVRITNPKAYPYYTTGKIESVWFNVTAKDGTVYTVTGSGTGSMQGPDLLTTAGHCIYGDVTKDELDDGINNSKFPDLIRYYPGLNGTTDKSSCIVVSALEISIGREYYENCSTEHDWAAVKLSTSIGYTTGWNGKMSNWYEKNHAVSSFGYPSDKNEDMWLTTGSVTSKIIF